MAGETANEQMDEFLTAAGTTPAPDADLPSENPDAGAADAAATPSTPATPEAAPPPRHVPIQALDEERNRRRDLEQQLAQNAERVARMEGAFQTILQQQQGRQPQNQIPDFETQPADHLLTRLQQLEAQAAHTAQTTQQFQQQTILQQQVISQTVRAEQEFSAAHPDYRDALQFMREARLKELEVFVGPDRALQALQMEEASVAANLLQQGRNPAEVIYNLARTRGWGGGQQAQGQDPQAQRLAQLAQQQAANKSLSGAQGGLDTKGAGVPKSLEELAQYDGEDFHKMFDAMMKNSRSGMGDLFH